MEQARAWLREASRVAVLTGAGISAESGIPTWRGSSATAGEGLWDRYRPEQLSSEEGFYQDPALVWQWYDWRRGVAAKAEPNAAHRALADWEQQVPEFNLITQNTDGLHERAGSQRMTRLHGSIWTLRCTRCGREEQNVQVPLAELPPLCHHCGSMQRPGVVWFGEELPDGAWDHAMRATQSCEVLLVVGTSGAVYPAALLIPIASRAGAKVIEINLEQTRFSDEMTCSLRGPAGELLPALLT